MKIIEKIIANYKDSSNNPRPLIAFLGDSVTQGCFLDYCNPEQSYSAKLKKKIDYLFPSSCVAIVNAGIGGTTAKFGDERLERDVLVRNPDLCIVCFGLNEVDEKCENIPSFTAALKSIFTRLQEAGSEVIYMTPNMMNTRYAPGKTLDIYKDYAQVSMKFQNEGIFDKFIDAAKKAAKECRVPVCDCYSLWKQMSKYIDITTYLSNGINHPDPEMHELFASELIKTMFS